MLVVDFMNHLPLRSETKSAKVDLVTSSNAVSDALSFPAPACNCVPPSNDFLPRFFSSLVLVSLVGVLDTKAPGPPIHHKECTADPVSSATGICIVGKTVNH